MEKTYGRRGVSIVDPMFFIPDGADELDYNSDGYYDEDAKLDTSAGGPSEGDDEDALEVPEILEIIQDLRSTNHGDVVDIVVVVQKIEGIKEFEVRVAKK